MGSTTEGVRAQSTTYNVQISYKRNSPESHGEKRRNHNESLTAPPLSWSRISISSFPIAVPAGGNLDQDLSTLLSIFGPRDCRLPGTILNWHNGEPIGTRNNVDETGCKNACESTQDCAAWTLNTQNGWCALKAENQIKKGANSGFVSEIRMGYHDCPNY